MWATQEAFLKRLQHEYQNSAIGGCHSKTQSFCLSCTQNSPCLYFGRLIYSKDGLTDAAKNLKWLELLPPSRSHSPQRLNLTPGCRFQGASWCRQVCRCQSLRLVCCLLCAWCVCSDCLKAWQVIGCFIFNVCTTNYVEFKFGTAEKPACQLNGCICEIQAPF